MTDLLNQLLFFFQRLNWLSVLDLALVTLIFYSILLFLRDTQALVLMRGVFIIIIIVAILTSIIDLPAFSWLTRNAVPALLLAVPVIFAPEIRRGLERLGRAGSRTAPLLRSSSKLVSVSAIKAVVVAVGRLSGRQHGALIVLQRNSSLQEYIQTGVPMDARVTPELLLQVFYPNTPLHDGAAIVGGDVVVAAACVMPLSASGILAKSPERQMGLRHRAALGTAESTDAIAVVVSEQTGGIAVAHQGRIIRNLDSDRLENILMALYYQRAQLPIVPSGCKQSFVGWDLNEGRVTDAKPFTHFHPHHSHPHPGFCHGGCHLGHRGHCQRPG
jgi:diadenylate cyclase